MSKLSSRRIRSTSATGHGRRAGDREPQAGQVVGGAVRVIEDRLVDRRRAGQHGDPLGLDQRHGPPGVVHRLRHESGAADQAGQDAGLVAEAVEERVDHQVAVGARSGRRTRPRPGRRPATAGGLLIAPLLRPVVPEVNRMSLTSPGAYRGGARSAASGGRGRRCQPGPVDARPSSQPHGGPGRRRRPALRRAGLDWAPGRPGRAGRGQRPARVWRWASLAGGAQRGEPVGAEERAGHDQGAGAAAADHVERLVAGEPGADRDQRRAGVQRAERAEHPVMGVGGPDGHPVAGGHARRRSAPGRRW